MNNTAEMIREKAAEILGTDAECLVLRKVAKTNGVELTGLSDSRKKVSPIIYIDKMIEAVENGEATIEDVAEKAVDYLTENNVSIAGVDGLGMTKNSILEGVRIRVVNAAKNDAIIMDSPNLYVLDLAAVPMLPLSVNGLDGTARVTNAMCDAYGIDYDELMETAVANTFKDDGFEIRSMSGILYDMSGREEYQNGPDMPFVVTSRDLHYGAAAIANLSLLSAYAEWMDDSYYILPSSVHEILLIPVGMAPMPAADLKDMVTAINAAEVAPDEVLSDHVYIFNRNAGTVEIAA